MWTVFTAAAVPRNLGSVRARPVTDGVLKAPAGGRNSPAGLRAPRRPVGSARDRPATTIARAQRASTRLAPAYAFVEQGPLWLDRRRDRPVAPASPVAPSLSCASGPASMPDQLERIVMAGLLAASLIES